MKKYIIFIIIIIIFVVSYFVVLSLPKDYEISYDVREYKVKEKYIKVQQLYELNVSKEDKNYFYYIFSQYDNKRKLVKEVNEANNCVYLNFKGANTYTLCLENDEYYVPINSINDTLIKKINNVNIYNKDKKFFIWNKNGLTDIINNKNYNILKNEAYDNLLCYQTEKYIIFKDYDEERDFNKFYIFSSSEEKYNELKFDFKISDNSYFLGHIQNDVYLFDKKNKKEYKIDLEKLKIELVSDTQGGIVFDGQWTNVPLANLEYQSLKFTNISNYNYYLSNNILYLSINNNGHPIKIMDSVKDLLGQNNDTVYFIVNDEVYSFSLYNGFLKLLSCFEWNFSYNNKIFIFE